ncbi:hypothetical protein [Kitasatospora phosalacinea]|uniref:Uncharacterized protein n=1 Tax=Kitasatospora phosalacinea TaxID=2065 RepID=A0A9W6PHC6_9ACTN|nr:hypothetical protein [Kitasatospora phosalacinea]GLW54923.1 hypothetical protein Kpho01_29340 [Kitasatospora phosalacinea]
MQLGVGTLVAVVAAVALLAVSGESGVWRIAVLVGFAVALGTLSAVLLSPAAARRLPPRARASATAQQAPQGQEGREQPAPSAARERVYAHQGH